MTTSKIVIPYLPVLDVIDLSSNGLIMEDRSCRLPVMVNNWRDQYPYVPISAVDVAYSSMGLYVRFVSRGKGLRCQALQDGMPVHRDSCVEVFLQKVDDSKYFNFEFNCCGTCDASYRKSREESTPFTAEQYKMIRRATSIRPQLIDDRHNTHSYWVTCMIPFTLLGYNTVEELPEYILANFYKCGDDTAIPHFASWMPIQTSTPDFHRPESFQPIYFGPRQKQNLSDEE